MIQELGNDFIPVFAIGCATVFLLVWVLCATVDSLYKTARNTKLKEQLVERGFSAHEISQIVGTGSGQANIDYENRPVPPIKPANGVHTPLSRV